MPPSERGAPHGLVACARVPDSDVRYTPFMNQRGGNAVSDVYECPTCGRRGRFLNRRLRGIACNGKKFVTGTPLEMEVASLRAAGKWPPTEDSDAPDASETAPKLAGRGGHG
jgi:hypothetical protein